MPLQYVPVTSSFISEVAYDEENHFLHFRFSNGVEKKYNATEHDYQDVLQADSVGKLWHARFKESRIAVDV